MGTLAKYLQQEFKSQLNHDWICSDELRILSPDLEKFLGYQPRADIMLQHSDGRRLWIELEISRADPVANHVKFATAHIFQPQPKTDTFISMLSSHIALGKRNLAASTIFLMRHIGMSAFHTALLPQISPKEIKRLNHLPLPDITQENLNIKNEFERILAISETLVTTTDNRIHFAGDLYDVLLNLKSWNRDIATDRGRELWGKRNIIYFVFDPITKKFAPSKFCAYVSIRPIIQPYSTIYSHLNKRIEMTIDVYVNLDGIDSRFDGRRARLHLMNGLAMNAHKVNKKSTIYNIFNDWLNQHSDTITVHPKGVGLYP